MDENIYTKMMQAGSKLKVKSALNPILWLCGMVSLPILFASCFTAVPWPLTLLAGCPVVVAIYSHLFLMHTNPDKLQSEEFQIQKISLEMTQQSGQQTPVRISSSAPEVISNPATPEKPSYLEGE